MEAVKEKGKGKKKTKGAASRAKAAKKPQQILPNPGKWTSGNSTSI